MRPAAQKILNEYNIEEGAGYIRSNTHMIITDIDFGGVSKTVGFKNCKKQYIRLRLYNYKTNFHCAETLRDTIKRIKRNTLTIISPKRNNILKRLEQI